MTKRYYVVEHTFRVVHEYGEWSDLPQDEQDSCAEFYFCENHCSGNTVNELAAVANLQPNICLTCYGHSAKMLGAYATEAEAADEHHAIVLNTESESYKDE